MVGSNDYFKSIIEPEVEYSYFGPPRKFVSYHCHVYKRIIIGNSLVQPLFINTESRCWPEDLFCSIQENMIIWEKDIIHSCPFFLIRSINVTIIDSMVLGETLMFQITNKQNSCGLNIMSTTEGLYLTLDPQGTKLETSNIELDMKTHFMLAEVDYKFEALLRIIDNYNNKIENQICNLLKDKLTLLANYTYLTLNDENNVARVIFKDNGELIITTCVDISKISIATSNKFCYKHIPISFVINNTTMNGFLRENNLLTLESQEVNCNSKYIIEIGRNSLILTSENGKIIMTTSGRSTTNMKLSFFSLSHLPNFHNKELLDPYNLVNQVEKLIHIDDIEGTYHLVASDNKRKIDAVERNKIESTYSQNFSFWFHNALLYIFIIVTTTITILIIIHHCVRPIPFKNRLINRVRYNTNTEEVNFEIDSLKHQIKDTQDVLETIVGHEHVPLQNSQLTNTQIQQLQKQANNEIKKFHSLN